MKANGQEGYFLGDKNVLKLGGSDGRDGSCTNL